jgi:hypothetical protein
MSFLWIPKSIRHRTVYSFFYENVELPTNCISEAGKRADMILVNGNPVENIKDIRNVAKVVTNQMDVRFREIVGERWI